MDTCYYLYVPHQKTITLFLGQKYVSLKILVPGQQSEFTNTALKFKKNTVRGYTTG